MKPSSNLRRAAIARAQAASDDLARAMAGLLPERVRELAEAAANSDTQRVRRIAHDLIGEGALLGSPLVSRLAVIVRDIAEAGAVAAPRRRDEALSLAAAAIRLAADRKLAEDAPEAALLYEELSAARAAITDRAL